MFHRIRDLGDALSLARKLHRPPEEEVWLIHGDDPEPEWADEQPGYFWVVSATEAANLIEQSYDGYPISDLDDQAPPPSR